MNNKANNTNSELGEGGKEYPMMLAYWNLYHVDELIQTNWIFYTYIDNLSFLGGLLDIALLVPSFLMIAYTYSLWAQLML